MDIDDPYAYAQFHLELIAKGLPSVMSNSVFRSILDDEVGKCFDGDYNVLFVRLVEACDSANLDLINEMKLYLFANGQDTSLFDPIGAFNGIEGHNYFPQIYIPCFTENDWDNEEMPVAIAFNGYESVVEFEGYTIGSGNQYDVVGGIDEDFSYNRQVWVISLNECVDDNGIPLEYCDEEGNVLYLGGDNTALPGGSMTTDAEIEKITIRERFENWAGGRSDIAIRCFAVKMNGSDPVSGLGFVKNGNDPNYRGALIKRVKKKDINDGTEFTIFYPIATNWGCGDKDIEHIRFVFTIFERDCWPASVGKGWPDITVGDYSRNILVRTYGNNDQKQVYVLKYVTSMAGIDSHFYNTPNITNLAAIKLKIKKIPD